MGCLGVASVGCGGGGGGGNGDDLGEFEQILEIEEGDILALDVTPGESLLVGLEYLDDADLDYPGGLLRSTDGGESFEHALEGHDVYDFASVVIDGEEHIFAGVAEYGDEQVSGEAKVLRSTDDGESWETVAGGEEIENAVYVAADGDGYVYTPTDVSDDAGDSWSSHGLVEEYGLYADKGDGGIEEMTIGPNGSVFVATDGAHDGAEEEEYPHLYMSHDRGESWEYHAFVEEPDEEYGYALWSVGVTDAGSVLVGTEYGSIFRSADGGETWEMTLEYGDPHDVFDSNTGIFDRVYCFATASDGRVAAGRGRGVQFSDDDGQTWPMQAGGLSDGEMCDFDSDDTLFAAQSERSSNAAVFRLARD